MELLTPDELLIVWRDLNLTPRADNAKIREKVKDYLEKTTGASPNSRTIPLVR